MNTNSNTYTIIYSAVLVSVVAAILAILAISLKEPQEKNKRIEKMQNILLSAGKGKLPDGADKNTFIEEEYNKYIVDSYVIGVDGSKKDVGISAFDIDLKEQLALAKKDRLLPVFVFQEGDTPTYILPVRGAGLWGPIWGYVAVASDGNTLVGAVFDHKGETPGLGAEIATPAFYEAFIGKQLFDGDKFISVKVVKPGSTEITAHNVDGISGGTITSSAVGEMLRKCLANYVPFLLKQRASVEAIGNVDAAVTNQGVNAADSTSLNAGEAPVENTQQ